MTALEKQRFLDGISGDPDAYYNMLRRVNVARSECSRAEDRESIHAGIRDSVGFGDLGRMVFGVMEEWMVQELRAQVAAKQGDGDERRQMRWSGVLGSILRVLESRGGMTKRLNLKKQRLRSADACSVRTTHTQELT
jgi:hypothetical protein